MVGLSEKVVFVEGKASSRPPGGGLGEGPRAPDPIDKWVGDRVRTARVLRGMSQDQLGQAVGLTFQQIQKYEKGVNRIGASRLYRLSQVLDVPLMWLFEDCPMIGKTEAADPRSQELTVPAADLKLAQRIAELDPAVRASVVSLIDAVTGD